MPSKNGSENSAALRRSPRAPARVKVKFSDETTPEKRGRKRKYVTENNDSTVASSPKETVTEAPVESARPPLSRKRNAEKKMDTYCWVCHKKGDDEVCAVCPRVYHYQCLGPKKRFTEDGICPECRLQSTDGTDQSDYLKQKMRVVLPLVLNRISEKASVFKTWSGNESQNENLVCIMDLSILQDRLLDSDIQYKFTAAFLADVKWLHHNCHIVYGPHDQLTNKAKAFVNECRNELIDLEACPECYIRSHDITQDTFAVVCKYPHTLVWAKMKGFPFWPAKVLKVIDSVANLRFFGSHDKGKVPVSHCYFLSEESPNDKIPKKANFVSAINELRGHIENLVERQGRFQYVKPKTKYDPGNANILTKLNKVVPTPKSGTPKTKRAKVSESNDVQETVDVQGAIRVQGASDIQEVPVMNNADEVIDITEPEESGNEHSSESNEIEIIEESQCGKKVTFLDNLTLFRANNSSSLPVAIVNVNSQAHTQRVSSRPRMNNLEMEFCEDETPETMPNPSHFLSGPSESLIDELPVSIEESVKDIVNNIIVCVDDGSLDYDFQPVVPSDLCYPSVSDHSSMQPEIQIVGGNSRGSMRNEHCHSHRLINDYNGVNVVINPEENMLSGPEQHSHQKLPNPAKYCHKALAHLNSIIQEVISDCFVPYSDCEKREVELKEEIEKHKQRGDEIKTNTDFIIKSLNSSVETEKQKAVQEAKKAWEEEMLKKMEETSENAQKEKDTAEKKYEELIAEMNVKHQTELREMTERLKEQYKKEKDKAVEIAKKKVKKDMAVTLTNTKRTQWCAFCLKEARFFCCWNTSYCDEDCQRNHWVQHVDQCENICRNSEAYTQAALLVAPQTEMTIGGKKSKKATDNTNGQLLPTLRPNGQPVPRFINSGTNIGAGSIPLQSSRPTIVTLPQKSHVVKKHGNSAETSTPPMKKTVRGTVASSPKPAEPKSVKDKE